eukprot:TRINITY_DN308_c0_g1_i2.p1 TRINITY_DN308_c0_g1~~TRINITY_DN308_c0_g1_i2.p1  ORF type:complete len:140 (-),score=30.05 TRINITY_DN308_c0_g1_i2:54-473(-)
MISLPFHANSWRANQVMHEIALTEGPDAQDLFDWISLVYQNLDQLSAEATDSMTGEQIRDLFVSLAPSDNLSTLVGESFTNATAEQASRDAYRIGVLRQVFRTPSFFLNGSQVTNADSTTTADQWRNLIDPLLQTVLKS